MLELAVVAGITFMISKNFSKQHYNKEQKDMIGKK